MCQHVRPSHLRSGAFKALGNLAVALVEEEEAQAAAAAAQGGAATPAGGASPAAGRRPGASSHAVLGGSAGGAASSPDSVSRKRSRGGEQEQPPPQLPPTSSAELQPAASGQQPELLQPQVPQQLLQLQPGLLQLQPGLLQPGRCRPAPVSLLALYRLPSLLPALVRGVAQSEVCSEKDKAARGAAKTLGEWSWVGWVGGWVGGCVALCMCVAARLC